jgi:DNA-directed RNA polymerase beta subunit
MLWTNNTNKSIQKNLILPDLVEIQRSSFKSFLNEGLSEVLDSFPQIVDPTNRLELNLYGNKYFYIINLKHINYYLPSNVFIIFRLPITFFYLDLYNPTV